MVTNKNSLHVKRWRQRHRKKQQLYNYRSSARAYINRWADINSLDKLIKQAKARRKQLAKEQ